MDDKWREAQDMLEIMAVKRNECPRCQNPLEHFSGLEHTPEFLYCPKCNDKAYDESGRVLFPIE